MSTKIVAPAAVGGDVVELTLNFQLNGPETSKEAHVQDETPPRTSADHFLPPKVALPKDHLNCWNLGLLENDPLLDVRVKALLPTWDFHLIEIPTSFQPGLDTRIIFGEVEVSLDCGNRNPQPRVYRLIPEQVTADTKETTEFGLDPSLEIKDTAKVSLGRWIKTIEIANLKPRVTGFWHEHRASWALADDSSTGVLGTKVFYLILQESKNGGSCGLILRARARVQTRVGLFFTRTSDYNYVLRIDNPY
ncbi:MAG TPA: hypothetical protein VHA33_21745 [Candidatus Angelobacter sp.]|jgi:hypothetical protein|nr:hypothetical protein [Candidatus Angelobacter sp.]